MKPKPISRREFLINSIAGAAGIGFLADCNSNNAVGPVIRQPSAPKGLDYVLDSTDTSISVTISWKQHDLTDITGAKTVIGITGYNVFRDNNSIATLVTGTSFVDATSIQELQTYSYTLTAVDDKGNESPKSDPLLVAVQQRVEVFQVTDATAVGSASSSLAINGDKVKAMLDASMLQLTGKSTVSAAWESLFPILSAATLIGIKVNTLGGGNLSTKPAVIEAIVGGLTGMLGGSFSPYNIIVFDDRDKDSLMKTAGFALRDDAGNYRIASANWNTTLHGVSVDQSESLSDLWGTALTVNGVSEKLSAIAESVDYIINVPILKDHSQSGITFSMKNLYGMIQNPQNLHGTMCSPYIPALYSQEVQDKPLKDKIRLIVGDALLGCFSGGPTGTANMIPCTLVVGTDPVAMDTWALRRINTERVKFKMPQISFTPTGDARHVLAASLDPYSLGSTNCVIREVSLT